MNNEAKIVREIATHAHKTDSDVWVVEATYVPEGDVDEALQLAATTMEAVDTLREVAAARCDGKGHWSHKGAPEGPGHTVRQCVRWDCGECGCSDRFWTAFDAAVKP